MKVAIILGNDLLKPAKDIRAYREALAITKAGYEVTVFCWSRGLEKYETTWKETDGNIQIIRVFEDVEKGFFRESRSTKKAMKQIRAKVEEYNPKIIHTHDLNTLETSITIKKKTKSKIIFDCREHLPAKKKLEGWISGKYYNYKQTSLLKNVDAILATSDELGQMLGESVTIFESEPLELVKKSVNTDRFGLDGMVAGYIGAAEKSNVEELLEIVSKIGGLSLLVIGGPPKGQKDYNEMISELEDMAIEKGANAKFTGPLPHSMMGECFAACDIVIVGHYVDRSLRDFDVPKTLLDAMAYKVPVVAGPYKARKRIIERYKCGIVSEDWVKSLNDLSQNKNLREEMGGCGFKAFKMNYAWELQEDKLLEVYRELLNEEGEVQ